jgi:hypothetical protein
LPGSYMAVRRLPNPKYRGCETTFHFLYSLSLLSERPVRGPYARAAATQFIANPQLFADGAAARAAMATWPLQPVHLVNGNA